MKIARCKTFVVFFITWEILKFCALKFLRISGSLFKTLLKLLVQKCLRRIIHTHKYPSPDFGLADPQKFLFKWGKHNFIFIQCYNICLLTHILVCSKKKNFPGLTRYWLLTSPLLGGGGGYMQSLCYDLLFWLMVFLCLFIPFTVTPECCMCHLHVNQDSAKFWHASGIYQIRCVAQASA